MNKLIINELRVDKRTNLTGYSYNLGNGKIEADNIQNLNDAVALNDLAYHIKDDYTEFVYKQNELFKQNGLIYKNELSLYFLSDFANKRTEVFDTFLVLSHISIIKKHILEKKIEKIILTGCDEKFVSVIKDSFKSIEIEEQNTKKDNKRTLFRLFLQDTNFFLQSFFKIIYLKFISGYKNKIIFCKKLFLARFPLAFNAEYQEEKYNGLLGENDAFLIHILTDGLIQGQSIKSYIRQLNCLKEMQKSNNIFLLDSYIDLKDIIIGYICAIKNYPKILNLLKNKFIFDGIDLTPYIKDEIFASFIRIPRLLFQENAIKKSVQTSQCKEFIYYLHEYSYGRFFTYVLKKNLLKIKTIGLQHCPVSHRKILCNLAQYEPDIKNSKDYINHLPIPCSMMAEDIESKKVYESFGYENVEILQNVPRLSYLSSINRDNIVPNSVLVACGLHDADLIFDKILDLIKKNKDIKYYFKLHPKGKNTKLLEKIEDLNLHNIEIAKGSIQHYLSFVGIVIVTYSSVGFEAYKLGINVEIVLMPNKILESSLYDIKDELVKIIE